MSSVIMSVLRATWIVPRHQIVLAGDAVELRTPRRADFAAFAALRAHSRAFLEPWEPTWTTDELTRAAFRRRIGRIQQEIDADSGYSFFLFRRSDNALIGGLNFSNVRRGVAQAITLGYWMGEPYAGQGLMSAGVRAALPYLFDTLGLHRIEAACIPRNIASQRVLERVGFTREGQAKAYLRINGAWEDHILFSFTRGDAVLPPKGQGGAD